MQCQLSGFPRFHTLKPASLNQRICFVPWNKPTQMHGKRTKDEKFLPLHTALHSPVSILWGTKLPEMKNLTPSLHSLRSFPFRTTHGHKTIAFLISTFSTFLLSAPWSAEIVTPNGAACNNWLYLYFPSHVLLLRTNWTALLWFTFSKSRSEHSPSVERTSCCFCYLQWSSPPGIPYSLLKRVLLCGCNGVVKWEGIPCWIRLLLRGFVSSRWHLGWRRPQAVQHLVKEDAKWHLLHFAMNRPNGFPAPLTLISSENIGWMDLPGGEEAFKTSAVQL